MNNRLPRDISTNIPIIDRGLPTPQLNQELDYALRRLRNSINYVFNEFDQELTHILRAAQR